jgi:hypothetical protein
MFAFYKKESSGARVYLWYINPSSSLFGSYVRQAVVLFPLSLPIFLFVVILLSSFVVRILEHGIGIGEGSTGPKKKVGCLGNPGLVQGRFPPIPEPTVINHLELGLDFPHDLFFPFFTSLADDLDAFGFKLPHFFFDLGHLLFHLGLFSNVGPRSLFNLFHGIKVFKMLLLQRFVVGGHTLHHLSKAFCVLDILVLQGFSHPKDPSLHCVNTLNSLTKKGAGKIQKQNTKKIA